MNLASAGPSIHAAGNSQPVNSVWNRSFGRVFSAFGRARVPSAGGRSKDAELCDSASLICSWEDLKAMDQRAFRAFCSRIPEFCLNDYALYRLTKKASLEKSNTGDADVRCFVNLLHAESIRRSFAERCSQVCEVLESNCSSNQMLVDRLVKEKLLQESNALTNFANPCCLAERLGDVLRENEELFYKGGLSEAGMRIANECFTCVFEIIDRVKHADLAGDGIDGHSNYIAFLSLLSSDAKRIYAKIDRYLKSKLPSASLVNRLLFQVERDLASVFTRLLNNAFSRKSNRRNIFINESYLEFLTKLVNYKIVVKSPKLINKNKSYYMSDAHVVENFLCGCISRWMCRVSLGDEHGCAVLSEWPWANCNYSDFITDGALHEMHQTVRRVVIETVVTRGCISANSLENYTYKYIRECEKSYHSLNQKKSDLLLRIAPDVLEEIETSIGIASALDALVLLLLKVRRFDAGSLSFGHDDSKIESALLRAISIQKKYSSNRVIAKVLNQFGACFHEAKDSRVRASLLKPSKYDEVFFLTDFYLSEDLGSEAVGRNVAPDVEDFLVENAIYIPDSKKDSIRERFEVGIFFVAMLGICGGIIYGGLLVIAALAGMTKDLESSLTLHAARIGLLISVGSALLSLLFLGREFSAVDRIKNLIGETYSNDLTRIEQVSEDKDDERVDVEYGVPMNELRSKRDLFLREKESDV